MAAGRDECADKFDEDDELHAEAEGATEISYQDEFHQVVNGRVDPTTSLRK